MNEVTRLARMLRLYRAAEELTVKQLAKSMGMSMSAISSLECGGTQPRNATVAKVIDWLFWKYTGPAARRMKRGRNNRKGDRRNISKEG